MAAPNWTNRTLFHGDNLEFLRGMDSDTVHLIATDPPFNKAAATFTPPPTPSLPELAFRIAGPGPRTWRASGSTRSLTTGRTS